MKRNLLFSYIFIELFYINISHIVNFIILSKYQFQSIDRHIKKVLFMNFITFLIFFFEILLLRNVWYIKIRPFVESCKTLICYFCKLIFWEFWRLSFLTKFINFFYQHLQSVRIIIQHFRYFYIHVLHLRRLTIFYLIRLLFHLAFEWWTTVILKFFLA